MLYFSLAISAILLIIVNLQARFLKSPGAAIVVTSLLFAFGSVFCMFFFSPAVIIQEILLIISLVLWSFRPRWSFLGLSILGTLLAYVAAGSIAYRQTGRLQKEYPYVSMEMRLHSPKKHDARLPYDSQQLTKIDELIDHGPVRWVDHRRLAALRDLHENAMAIFVNQDGFGVSRMPTVSQWTLKAGLREEPPIPQSPKEPSKFWSVADLEGSPVPKNLDNLDKNLRNMLRLNIVDSVNPPGFGFIKDRRHVVGFQPHQFSKQPEPGAPWKVKNLELVGLVVHDEPLAYVSDHLPRMDELASASTRPLDDFEIIGLAALEKGEDLFVRRGGADRLYMLGAVRAGRKCLDCHGGERGELLGAFSYTLARE